MKVFFYHCCAFWEVVLQHTHAHAHTHTHTHTHIYIYIYIYTISCIISLDGNTGYFNIVAGILQGDILVPYLFIICLDYMLRTSINKIKENGFKLTKKRSRRYSAKTITNADYTDDIVLLANAPAQTETMLHSLERAAVGIGLHVNAHRQTDRIYVL